MQDATFEEGREAPLNLGAFEIEDLSVLSSLAQDAVFSVSDLTWQPKQRRFAILLNRFRWEDQLAAERRGRPYERVQSLLVLDCVTGVASTGFDRRDKDLVLSLLEITYKDGAVELVLAGDGALRFRVEALEVSLRDVSRPFEAQSKQAPSHPE